VVAIVSVVYGLAGDPDVLRFFREAIRETLSDLEAETSVFTWTRFAFVVTIVSNDIREPLPELAVYRLRAFILALGVGLVTFSLHSYAADPPAAVPECTAREPQFADQVWAKVGERSCLKCHNATGDASASAFILEDTSRKPEALERNHKAFTAMASAKKDGAAKLLAKASGSVKHGGGAVVKPGTSEYRILERFVARVDGKDKPFVEPSGFVPGPYFTGVAMATPQRHLR